MPGFSWSRTFLLTLLSIHTAHASVEVVYDHCDATAPAIITTHVVATIPADAKSKDFLTDWFDIPHLQGWVCTRYTNLPHPKSQNPPTLDIGLQTWPNDGLFGPFQTSPDGAYRIYATDSNHAKRMGYIMRRRMVIAAADGTSWESPWQAVRIPNHKDHTSQTHTLTLPHNTSYTVTIESQVRLLKWNNTFPQAGDEAEFQVAQFKYWTQLKLGYGPKPWESDSSIPPSQNVHARPSRSSRVKVTFNGDDRTCHTENQLVHLQPVPVSVFQTSGITAGKVQFDLELTGCTPNTTGIKYMFIPTQTGPVSSDGTLQNTGSASGVKVQILDENGTDPVPFNHIMTIPYSHYTPGANTAKIPLQVQYLQSEQTVTAGDVQATMTVLYMYQ